MGDDDIVKDTDVTLGLTADGVVDGVGKFDGVGDKDEPCDAVPVSVLGGETVAVGDGSGVGSEVTEGVNVGVSVEVNVGEGESLIVDEGVEEMLGLDPCDDVADDESEPVGLSLCVVVSEPVEIGDDDPVSPPVVREGDGVVVMALEFPGDCDGLLLELRVGDVVTVALPPLPPPPLLEGETVLDGVIDAYADLREPFDHVEVGLTVLEGEERVLEGVEDVVRVFEGDAPEENEAVPKMVLDLVILDVRDAKAVGDGVVSPCAFTFDTNEAKEVKVIKRVRHLIFVQN